MLLEVLTFNQDPAFAAQLVQLLERKTGRSFGFNIEQWQQWLWNQPPLLHPQYAEFKSALYGWSMRSSRAISLPSAATIRLDEVLWGGVSRMGFPPLRKPGMIPAARCRLPGG